MVATVGGILFLVLGALKIVSGFIYEICFTNNVLDNLYYAKSTSFPHTFSKKTIPLSEV